VIIVDVQNLNVRQNDDEKYRDGHLIVVGEMLLFGAVAGYAIKKIGKIAAVVVGLFVAALAYLSYRRIGR